MDCSCIYIDGDGEGPAFCYSKIRKARKGHTCTECRREIKPGEHYEHVTGKWEGELDTFKTCPECLDIRNIFFCESWAFGQIKSNLRANIYSRDGEVSEACMAALTPKARAIVCDIIERYWEDVDDNYLQYQGGCYEDRNNIIVK